MDVIYMSCTAFDPKCLNTDIQAKKKNYVCWSQGFEIQKNSNTTRIPNLFWLTCSNFHALTSLWKDSKQTSLQTDITFTKVFSFHTNLQ